MKLKIKIEDRTDEVDRTVYAKAKLAQMREFGYDITLKHLDEQIDAVLARKKFGKGLTIIGKFIEDEVICAVPDGSENAQQTKSRLKTAVRKQARSRK